MYYVVYLLDFDLYITIPTTWIRNSSEMFKKFVHGGVNCSQTHWCYFSNRADAQIKQNGITMPNMKFKANFNVAESDVFPCEEGIFQCMAANFFGKFGDRM